MKHINLIFVGLIIWIAGASVTWGFLMLHDPWLTVYLKGLAFIEVLFLPLVIVAAIMGKNVSELNNGSKSST